MTKFDKEIDNRLCDAEYKCEKCKTEIAQMQRDITKMRVLRAALKVGRGDAAMLFLDL